MNKEEFGEKLGSGFERIKETCEKENAPFPEIKFNENYFYVTFKQSHEYLKMAGLAETTQKTPQKTPQKILTGLETKILNEIIKNPRISRREIANILKISPDTVKEYLEKLKKKKVIKRIGPDRGGCWMVSEKESG